MVQGYMDGTGTEKGGYIHGDRLRAGILVSHQHHVVTEVVVLDGNMARQLVARCGWWPRRAVGEGSGCQPHTRVVHASILSTRVSCSGQRK
jgi:hypothetical protein